MKAFPSLRAARKGLKLPGGQDADVHSFEHDGVKHESYSWYKRGGYADKKLHALRDSLRKTRWKQTDSKGHCVPDGSYIGSTQYYAKGGWIVSVGESYGGVKWDNSFSVNLSKAKEDQ